jgi:hypothetical protein
MAFYQYPASGSVYSNEQPFWLNFYCASYSLKNVERTRSGIISRSSLQIRLPMPREPQYTATHEFGEGTNPVGPVMSLAALSNSGGKENYDLLLTRALQGGAFDSEYMFATTTYRRFSNITELTMVSEARKQYYFEYIFVPKNSADSEEVEGIVGSFRKASYPEVAGGLPERTYPQNLWTINVNGPGDTDSLTSNWLGEPLPCVLRQVVVKRNAKADPIIRYLPNGLSTVTLLGLVFTEFETGTYDSDDNSILSKSEVSAKYFGSTEV